MTYRTLRWMLTAVLVTALAECGLAQTPPANPKARGHDGAITAARSLLEKRLAGGIPGLSVAVGAGGRIVWAEGLGFADLENDVAVGTRTRFRIASVSKSVTAAAVGLLVEEGHLDLDAPVQKYVPSFPKKKYEITTRQLCGHLAGIRHYRGREMYSRRPYRRVKDALAIFAGDPLLHEPGTKFLYSSYGWNLVSAAVEGASGREFLAFLHERVFEPLGMRSSCADRKAPIVKGRARFYVKHRDGGFRNAPYVDNSCKWAGGGLLSTASDLVRFGLAHASGALFEKEETVELLMRSQTTNDGKKTGYGLGWSTWRDEDGHRFAGHSGGAIGGSAYLLVGRDSGVVVALLANVSRAPIKRAVAAKIERLFRKMP